MNHQAASAVAAIADQGPPVLEATDLVHAFGAVKALDHVSLVVRAGEFLTILGPSGSGKTTLLRVIGGFEMPAHAAQLSIAGTDVRGLPASHRAVATVFQHYALFPHMSVGENVEYGLRVRGVAPAARRARAEAVLKLVHLHDKYGRRINQLSGGEQQRAALARALVTEPSILLLDEPMSALDEKLRRHMQIEIRALQRQLGASFIQVTHSHEEALTMSDRIAVMNRGRIEQLDTPERVFQRPATRFVAGFMGMTNLMDGTIVAIDGHQVALGCAGRCITGCWTGAHPPHLGQPAFAGVHPERMRASNRPIEQDGWNTIDGIARNATYMGATSEITVETALGDMTARVDDLASGEPTIRLAWRREDCAIGPVEIPA